MTTALRRSTFSIKALGGGDLALGLGGFAFGFLGGGGHGDGRAAFVLAQRKYEQEDADVFAVEGQGARQRAVVGDALGVEGVG